jgi:hypothetical protein
MLAMPSDVPLRNTTSSQPLGGHAQQLAMDMIHGLRDSGIFKQAATPALGCNPTSEAQPVQEPDSMFHLASRVIVTEQTVQ